MSHDPNMATLDGVRTSPDVIASVCTPLTWQQYPMCDHQLQHDICVQSPEFGTQIGAVYLHLNISNFRIWKIVIWINLSDFISTGIKVISQISNFMPDVPVWLQIDEIHVLHRTFRHRCRLSQHWILNQYLLCLRDWNYWSENVLRNSQFREMLSTLLSVWFYSVSKELK